MNNPNFGIFMIPKFDTINAPKKDIRHTKKWYLMIPKIGLLKVQKLVSWSSKIGRVIKIYKNIFNRNI